MRLTTLVLIGAVLQAPHRQDFQSKEAGALPVDVKVVRGEFAVAGEGAERFLELSVHELNAFGVLVGPDDLGATGAVRVRTRGWPSGRRFPEMGAGLGGTAGYRVWLMPAVKEVQLRKGSQIVARAPFDAWAGGEWVNLHLEVRQTRPNRWSLAGKAWRDGADEPREAMVWLEVDEAPPTGRAALWATPYSEKPVHFDDVLIEGR